MTLYDIPGRGTLGKDSPYGKSTSLFRPNLNTPGGGKIKAGIYIGYKLGRYIMSRPWAKGTLTGTILGTGLGLDGTKTTNVGSANHYQAYDKSRKRSNNKRYNKTHRANRCCHTSRCY